VARNGKFSDYFPEFSGIRRVHDIENYGQKGHKFAPVIYYFYSLSP
jgi:hypothetical protein